MAIAVDATSSGIANVGTTHTFSFTCGSGANRILFVATYRNAGTDTVSGVTYNGVAMTVVNQKVFGGNNIYLWYLVNPASGANNVVVTTTSSLFCASCCVSYTGASQTGVPDSSNTNSAISASGLTCSSTVVAANCWLVEAEGNTSGGAPTAGAGSFIRITGTNIAVQIVDSNGTVSTGSQSLIVTGDSSRDYGGVIASFAPAAATTSPNGFFLMV